MTITMLELKHTPPGRIEGTGFHRGCNFCPTKTITMRSVDLLTSYQRLFCGLTLCDFGCGAGNFLRLAKSLCKAVHGIELQDNFVQQMQNDGISCSKVFPEQATYDVVTLFHVLEHLPDFRGELRKIYARLKDGGCVVVEVPHARDFLLDRLCSEKFKQFTLWSQHLVLHVRDSLRRALMDVGFKNVQIEGVQRYGISNHMGWLANGLPGGHKSSLSCLETPELVAAYAMAMSKIDANDTLVAIATK